MNMNAQDDEFANFLDLDTDFSNLDGLDHGHSGLDTPMGRLGFGQFAMPVQDGGTLDMDMGRSMAISDAMLAQVSVPGPIVHNATYRMPPHHTQMLPHGYHVPLTPLSSELHGAKYPPQLDAHQQALYDRGQLTFTPLVSPAPTPLDSNFRMPEYLSNNDFFSPLSSPAIDAQHVLGSNNDPISPADVPESSKRSHPGSKRGRRKGSISTRAPARSVKQSPAMKAQSRKRPQSVTSIPNELLEVMNNGTSVNTGHMAGSAPAPTSDSSVSPEPLTDVLMPPPAMPPPLKSANNSSSALSGMSAQPATPATLMRIPTSQLKRRAPVNGHSNRDEDDAMYDVVLPDSAVISPLLDATDRPVSTEGDATPTLLARSAKNGTIGTPRPGAATPRMFSPETRAGARGNKKRQGTSSATISPALRPKISPSISPLVPAPGKTSYRID